MVREVEGRLGQRESIAMEVSERIGQVKGNNLFQYSSPSPTKVNGEVGTWEVNMNQSALQYQERHLMSCARRAMATRVTATP